MLAERLYAAVVAAAGRSEVERSALAAAFFELDRRLGERLAAEVGVTLDVRAADERRVAKSRRRVVLAPIREQVSRLDQTGDDYDVSELTGLLEE